MSSLLHNATANPQQAQANKNRNLTKRILAQELKAGVSGIKAGTITGDMLTAGTITATSIAAGTITGSLIASGTILAGNIAAGTITSAQIAAFTIVAGNIAAATITGTQIAATTITASNIAASTITGAKIAAFTITAGLIQANTITAAQIQAGTITATEIATDTITATQIAANAITTSELASGSVTAAKIVAGTITSTEIASSTITGSNIAGSTITASKISISQLSALAADLGTITAGTVTGATVQTASSGKRVVISSGGITAYDGTGSTIALDFSTTTGNLTIKGAIQSGSTLPSGIVGSAEIANGSVTGTDIAGTTISASNIVSGTITTTQIAATTIVAGNIASGTITGTQIAATTIAAGNIVSGTITGTQLNATAIDAMTITGATLRTASSGARVEISGTAPVGIKKYDASGNVTVQLGSTDGLQLLGATTTTPPNDRTIQWLDGSSNVLTSLSTYVSGGVLATRIRSTAPASGVSQTTGDIGIVNAAGALAALSYGYNSIAGSFVSATAGSVSKNIIKSDGTSEFLQLISAANKRLATGTATLSYSAASTTTVTAAHGLGATPSFFIAVADRSSLGILTNVGMSADSTNLTIQGTRIDGAAGTGSVTVYWLAIG